MRGRDEWGSVRYVPETITLQVGGDYHGQWMEYEIDLERAGSSAQALDWILQLAGKSWATPEMVGNVAIAFNELFGQGVLCPFGAEQEFDVKEVLAQRGYEVG